MTGAALEGLLARLLRSPPPPREMTDLDGWRAAHDEAAAGLATTIERAAAGAFVADRLGYAFASGYREALRALIPEVGEAAVGFCATEEGPAAPKHMKAALVERPGGGWRLDGVKRWTTMGTRAQELLVFAVEGTDDRGRNRLALVRIPADREGVTVEPGAETTFIPEIPHAVCRFEGVAVAADERLPGDAYERYLKPFRTVEDLHVHVAFVGWLMARDRRREVLEAGASWLCAAASLAEVEALSSAGHVALAGLLDQARRLAEGFAGDERWERDRRLLDVAGGARAARREAAWGRLGRL